MTRTKPRFTVREWRALQPFLCNIRRAALSYTHSVGEAASDVLDGWARDADVAPLVRERVLKVIPGDECPACRRCRPQRRCEDCRLDPREAPYWHTWWLTDRGIALICPESEPSR